mmetsp:Transcript_48686/g.121874  ORF Transcript_48686/g.121874 Transcript_48686/m.121874 type:complete len:276 (+) Transcript_48686:769-1596(+)
MKDASQGHAMEETHSVAQSSRIQIRHTERLPSAAQWACEDIYARVSLAHTRHALLAVAGCRHTCIPTCIDKPPADLTRRPEAHHECTRYPFALNNRTRASQRHSHQKKKTKYTALNSATLHIRNTMGAGLVVSASRLLESLDLRLWLGCSDHTWRDVVLHNGRRGKVGGGSVLVASGPRHMSVFLCNGARHTPEDKAAVPAAVGRWNVVMPPQFGAVDKKDDEHDDGDGNETRVPLRYQQNYAGTRDHPWCSRVVRGDLFQNHQEQSGEVEGAEH